MRDKKDQLQNKLDQLKIELHQSLDKNIKLDYKKDKLIEFFQKQQKEIFFAIIISILILIFNVALPAINEILSIDRFILIEQISQISIGIFPIGFLLFLFLKSNDFFIKNEIDE